MAQATRSHSAKDQLGGTGVCKRNVRADFTRDFLPATCRIPLRRAAASSTLRSPAVANCFAPETRNCDHRRFAMRKIHRLRASLRSIALRVARILADEYSE